MKTSTKVKGYLTSVIIQKSQNITIVQKLNRKQNERRNKTRL